MARPPSVISMTIYTVVSISSWLSTTTAIDVSIVRLNDIPYIYAGTDMELICLAPFGTTAKYRYTWYKDGETLASYDGNGNRELTVNSGASLPSVTEHTLIFASKIFLYLTFVDVSEDHHTGVYTCVAENAEDGETSSASYSMIVQERRPICQANKPGAELEYLIGKSVSLTCYNPIYTPRRTVTWSHGEVALPTLRTEFEDTSMDNATLVTSADMNGTTYVCDVVNADSTGTPLSCSIGPVKVYQSSFIYISESDPANFKDSRTFTCRFVPSRVVEGFAWTGMDWYDAAETEPYNITNTDVSSTITFFDLSESSLAGSEISIKCIITSDGINMTESHSFFIPPNTGESEKDSSAVEGFPSLLFIIICAVVILICLFTGLFVIVCCALGNTRRRKNNRSSPLEPEEGQELPDNSSRYVVTTVSREPSMVLSKLPDGRFQLRPRQLDNISEDSFGEEELSPLSPGREMVYDLPPCDANLKPSSPIYSNNL